METIENENVPAMDGETKFRVEEWKEAFAQMIAKGHMMLSKKDSEDVLTRVCQIFPELKERQTAPPKWTRKKPVVPGTYWIWAKNLGWTQLCYAVKPKVGNEPFLTTTGGAIIKTPAYGDELFEGQWICGPIYEPADPLEGTVDG